MPAFLRVRSATASRSVSPDPPQAASSDTSAIASPPSSASATAAKSATVLTDEPASDNVTEVVLSPPPQTATRPHQPPSADRKRLSFMRPAALVRLPSAGVSAGIAGVSAGLSAARKMPTALPKLTPSVFKTTRSSGRKDLVTPSASEEQPVGWVKCRVEAARGLTAKDRNGKSDPFVVLSVTDSKAVSDVKQRTLDPVWCIEDSHEAPTSGAAEVTFAVWPSTLTAERIEIILFDKDKLRKEYLGEVSLGLNEWFDESWKSDGETGMPKIAWSDSANIPQWFHLQSLRKTTVSGDVKVRIGFLEGKPASPTKPTSPANLQQQESSASAALAAATADISLLAVPAASFDPAPYTVAELGPLIKGFLLHEATGQLTDDDLSPSRRRSMWPRRGGSDSSSGKKNKKQGRRIPRGERVLTAPPTEGVGTVSHHDDVNGWELSAGIGMGKGQSDDEDTSDDDEDYVSVSDGESILEDVPEDEVMTSDKQHLSKRQVSPPAVVVAPAPFTSPVASSGTAPGSRKSISLPKFIRRTSGKPDTAAPDAAEITASKAPSGTVTPSNGGDPNSVKRLFGIRKSSADVPAAVAAEGAAAVLSASDSNRKGGEKGLKKRRRRRILRRRSDYSFQSGGADDILGLCFVEIKGATNLPRWKNMTRTGYDMDPFAIISFGQKIFRTRVIRHSLDPKWDEKLFFHVRRNEIAFSVQISIFDWDKMSSNDYVGECSLRLADLVAKAPQPDPETGLYRAHDHFKLSGDELFEFEIPIVFPDKSDLETQHGAKLQLRAKYAPYAAMRQIFWRKYMQQFDADDSGTISYVELFSMLDSLGSTLSQDTINSFFTRYGKSPEGTLSQDEVVACLEKELMKPREEKALLDPHLDSGTVTPALGPNIASLDLTDNAKQPYGFTGPNVAGIAPEEEVEELEPAVAPITKGTGVATMSKDVPISNPTSVTDTQESESEMEGSGHLGSADLESESVERVINISSCPLCHKERIDSRMEADLVTHLAVCASQDWSTLDRIPVGNFVTASQAHRKWVTKIISKVQNGAYSLGADSANIIVQDRRTGQLMEEKMQVYVRAGIRLLYKGLGSSTMEGQRIRKLLYSMSIKQGKKYDAKESVREIAPFIAFHNLDMAEVLDPIENFKTFNEFFYRKLKEGARPVDSPQDPSVLVSCADCRMMAFTTIEEATRIWIKGREFSIARLLGERYGQEAKEYEGGALAIFRLAPQDYHRFHAPVDGVVGELSRISGQYYTVNPMAIRSTVDVYGENVRTIVPIDTEAFGRVFSVHIGAMLVGSTVVSVNQGDKVSRGQDIGYFAFGGSTIVTVFPPNTVKWDDDLITNAKHSIETLVRVGSQVGRSVRAK